jgi:secondary thiamine-phosphate synthase enzyme
MKKTTRKSTIKTYHESISLKTQECLQFIDLTDVVIKLVEKSAVQNGFVNIQTKHTTTAILVNEHEPLLLEDMKKVLERMVPQDIIYQHNDFGIRTVNMGPDENENGHSHCKALLLRTSETLNIVDGKIQLGLWQRVFFIELDRARDRNVSVMVMGI